MPEENVSDKTIPAEVDKVKPVVIVEDKAWQKKLLPFMIVTLIGLTVFFIVASYLEFRDFKTRLDKQSDQNELKTVLDNADNKFSAPEDKDKSVEYTKWRTMVWLEKESISQRYTHSNTLILSRMWTRYIGFLVGMILAIVGAVFILGKLRESEMQLGAEANLFKFTVTSASPGIILATLGTILLLTTVVVTTDVKVADGSIYVPLISHGTASSFSVMQQRPENIELGNTQLLKENSKTTNANSANTNSSENSTKRAQDDEKMRRIIEQSK